MIIRIGLGNIFFGIVINFISKPCKNDIYTYWINKPLKFIVVKI